MTTLIVPALSGLAAGFVHVLSGPDHLAAVAPLAVEARDGYWRPGFTWGLGHTGGVLLVGLLALLFRELLPVELLSSWGERMVGVVLIGIGLWGIRRAASLTVHVHEHTHDGVRHAHVHAHSPGAHPPAASHPHAHTRAAFAVGVLHGLAGSSHLLGVLPALAFDTRAASLAYLAAFGVATIGTMTGFGGLLGLFAERARAGGAGLYRRVLYACSIAAIIVGIGWLVM
jgi:ABC-type nickel/cobalt efflux system permease component RcnA